MWHPPGASLTHVRRPSGAREQTRDGRMTREYARMRRQGDSDGAAHTRAEESDTILTPSARVLQAEQAQSAFHMSAASLDSPSAESHLLRHASLKRDALARKAALKEARQLRGHAAAMGTTQLHSRPSTSPVVQSFEPLTPVHSQRSHSVMLMRGEDLPQSQSMLSGGAHDGSDLMTPHPPASPPSYGHGLSSHHFISTPESSHTRPAHAHSTSTHPGDRSRLPAQAPVAHRAAAVIFSPAAESRARQLRQLADAELYYRMSLQDPHNNFAAAADDHPIAAAALQQRPSTSHGASQHLQPHSARIPARPHTTQNGRGAGGSGSGSVTVRGAPLKTPLQLFQHDLLSLQQQRPSSSEGSTGGSIGPIRSVDVRPSTSPHPSAPHLVSPLTSSTHWSNRVYTHAPSASSAAALMSPRDRSIRATTSTNSHNIASQFSRFKRGIEGRGRGKGKSGAAQQQGQQQGGNGTKTTKETKRTGITGATIDAAPVPATAIAAASLPAESDSPFMDLLDSTRFAAHAASFHSHLLCERLDVLVGRELEVGGTGAGGAALEEQIARAQAQRQYVEDMEARDREARREARKTMHTHHTTPHAAATATMTAVAPAPAPAPARAPPPAAASSPLESKESDPPDPTDPSADSLSDRRQRHFAHFLHLATRDATALERERLEAHAADASLRSAVAHSQAAEAVVAAAALEVDYDSGKLVRPADLEARAAHALTDAGAFESALKGSVNTRSFLEQDPLSDPARPDRASSIAREQVENRHAREQQRAARRERGERRARGRRSSRSSSCNSSSQSGSSSGGDDGASSNSESEHADSFNHSLTSHPPTAPLTSPPSTRAAPAPALASAALSPAVVPLLSLHSLHTRAASTLDATAATMRARMDEEARRQAAQLAEEALQREQAAEAMHRRDLAALLRLENNQRDIQETRRSMAHKGTLHLSLLGIRSSFTSSSSSLSSTAKASAASSSSSFPHLLSLVPSGYVCRFEVRLLYALPDLPQIVAYTLPFSRPPDQAGGSVCCEVLQSISLKVLNAQVQRIVVTLQALTGKQILAWMFAHRHALFGPKGGLDQPIDHLSHLDGDVRVQSGGLMLLAPTTHHAEGQIGGRKPTLSDYLRFCSSELRDVSARSSQSWMPPAVHPGQPHPSVPEARTPLLLLSSAPPSSIPTASPPARRPSTSQHSRALVLQQQQHESSKKATLVRAGSAPRTGGGGGGSNSGGGRVQHGGGLFEQYQHNLTAWFAQGAPSAPHASGPSVSPAPPPPAAQSHRARVMQAHVAASGDVETFGGWLQALRARQAAASEQAKDPLGRNEQVEAAEADLVTGGRAGQRARVIASWSAEQVALWLEAIGIRDSFAVLQLRSLDGAALLAAAPAVSSLAKRAQQHADFAVPDLDSKAAIAAAAAAKEASRVDAEAANQQRIANAVHLHRCLSLLTHAQHVYLSPLFDLESMSLLRGRVLAAFHRASTLPEYVAAETARQEEIAATATTAALTPDEQHALELRLVQHNKRKAEQESARSHMHSRAATASSARSVSSHPASNRSTPPTKLLLESQLQTMEHTPERVVQAYRARRKLPAVASTRTGASASTASSVQVTDEHDDSADSDAVDQRALPHRERASSSRPSTRASGSTSLVAMFQDASPRPSTIVSLVHESSTPSAAAVAASPRILPQEDTVLQLGCFELPVRTVARAPDGVMHTAMKLKPVQMTLGEDTSLTAPSHASSTSSPVIGSFGAGIAASSTPRAAPLAHYRADLTTRLSSSSPRTFMVASSVPSTARGLPSSSEQHSSPSVTRPPSAPSLAVQSVPAAVPRALRHALNRDAALAADEGRRAARVDIEARFTHASDDTGM